ncbi:hypothetical protein BFJ68_g9189 [Fusarium oxysporum]|uniref:Uncharacterized protein n=1 Tax=Fusarium oxysporum TaxID=5507 RepID=A0A420QWU3_FUSOX|nr:hypothetical protein BFJ68_g9189 [Fusarium oxysporum]
MPDCADPLCGWSLYEVDKTPIGLATSDIYGKLFYYVRSMLEKFMYRMSKLTIAFQLLQVHAATLPNHLDESFDRIDVSNISDSGYLGAHRTVALRAPLLRVPPTNPHAILITLFMNLIDENFTLQDQTTEWTLGSLSTKRLANYLLPTRPNRSIIDPALMKYAHARHHMREYDDIFGRCADKLQLARMPDWAGAVMKEEHTIIKKWPHRLKLEPGQEGGSEEFYRLMTSGLSSRELYLEWKRVQTQKAGQESGADRETITSLDSCIAFVRILVNYY